MLAAHALVRASRSTQTVQVQAARVVFVLSSNNSMTQKAIGENGIVPPLVKLLEIKFVEDGIAPRGINTRLAVLVLSRSPDARGRCVRGSRVLRTCVVARRFARQEPQPDCAGTGDPSARDHARCGW